MDGAKILIDADDLASKKFEQAARNAERNIKAIKETGAKAKASTEFFGQLANALGGSQLASYAGQMAGLTEKTSQFAEVSKLGGAGALAFKAGLVGLAATITYQVTTAIAGLIYDLDNLEKKMKRTAEESVESFNRLTNARQRIFQERIEDADLRSQLSGSGVDPLEERRKIQAELAQEIAKATGEIRKANSAIDAYESQWIKLDPVQARFIEQEKARVDALKSAVAQMESMQEQLRGDLSSRARQNEAIKEQIKLQEEQRRIEQANIDAQERDKQRVQDLLEKEIDNLKRQRIELEQGAEAAHAFALEKQGLAKADAERIAAEQAEIDKLKEKKQQQAGGLFGGDLVAFESRLLTRGPMNINRQGQQLIDLVKQIRDKMPMHSTPSQRLEVSVVG